MVLIKAQHTWYQNIMTKRTHQNYQPNQHPTSVLCLSTSYKFLNSILTEWSCNNLTEYEICPVKIKCFRRSSYSSNDRFLINRMILEHTPLRVVWIDHQKAFYSIQYSLYLSNNCEFRLIKYIVLETDLLL